MTPFHNIPRPSHQLLLLALLPLMLLVGCDPPGKPNPKDQFVNPDQVVDFEKLFSLNCAGCHGANGTLGPAPPLNDRIFASIISDEQLKRIVHTGRPGTAMPAFAIKSGGTLTDAQIEILATGIKTHWKSDASLPDGIPAYASEKNDSGAPTGNAQRGAELFSKSCVNCHGANGEGVDDGGIRKNAIHVSAFLTLISDQALRRIIITGRPDLGMPNFSEEMGRGKGFHSLTSTEIDDLVALLADWRSSGTSISQTNH